MKVELVKEMADRINFTICKHPILGAIFPMLQESAHLFEADFCV